MRTIYYFIIFCLFFTTNLIYSQTWNELKDTSYSYYNKKDYQNAKIFAYQALNQCEKEYGKISPKYAFTLKLLAELYGYTGPLDSVLHYAERSVAVYEKSGSGDLLPFADIMCTLALHYTYAENLEKADSLYIKGIAMNRRIASDETELLPTYLTNYALYCSEVGRLGDAEKYFNEALEIQRKISKEDNPDLLSTIIRTGEFYRNHGKLNEGEKLLIEALEMSKRLYPDGNQQTAMILYNLGDMYSKNREFEKAEKYLSECLILMNNLVKGDNGNVAILNSSLAECYLYSGKYNLAEKHYKIALEMGRRLYKKDNSNLATKIYFLANFYKTVGKYQQAELLYEEALAMDRRIFKTDNPELADGMIIVGTFYTSQKKYDEAIALLEEALKMHRRIYQTDVPGLLNAIKHLAVAYNLSNNVQEAEKLAKEALDMSSRIYQTRNHPNVLSCLLVYAENQYLLNRKDSTEKYIDEALKMAKNMYDFNNSALSTDLHTAAQFKYWLGNDIESESLFFDVMKMDSSAIINYFPYISEADRGKLLNKFKSDFESFKQFAIYRSANNPKILSNLYNIQLYSKSILLGTNNKIRNRVLNSGDSALINSYRVWNNSKSELLKLYKLSKDELKRRGLDLDSAENKINELEKEISIRSEDFKLNHERNIINWKSVQSQLKKNEAAVEVVRYAYRDKHRMTDTIHYAFLIVTDKTVEYPELMILDYGKQLESEYYDYYRENIIDKKRDNESFNRFWGPLHKKLKNYKKVYFSADGIYHKLNPSTLQLPDGRYLMDIQEIRSLNSTKDILIGQNKFRLDNNNKAVLIGNPNFSLSIEDVAAINKSINNDADKPIIENDISKLRGIKLTKLPGTEEEIKNIEKILNDMKWATSTYLGDKAVKEVVMNANNPRVLHIATHGLFFADATNVGKDVLGFDEKVMNNNPLLRSGLFFSGAESYLSSDSAANEDNCILTAYEAMNLNLDKTELVILSACETGLGDINTGEGVYGLQRAFQAAGANNIIMSLWKVSDIATKELMINFYKNWSNQKNIREAFRMAQKEIRKKYAEPFYWGGFIILGS